MRPLFSKPLGVKTCLRMVSAASLPMPEARLLASIPLWLLFIVPALRFGRSPRKASFVLHVDTEGAPQGDARAAGGGARGCLHAEGRREGGHETCVRWDGGREGMGQACGGTEGGHGTCTRWDGGREGMGLARGGTEGGRAWDLHVVGRREGMGQIGRASGRERV